MRKGFTLIELMIVVSIIGILAALAMPSVQGQIARAKESAAKDTLRTVRSQIEMYKMQHNGLAPGYMGAMQATTLVLQYQFIGTSAVNGIATSATTPSGTYQYGPYLLEMPANPFNGLTSITYISDAATDFSSYTDDQSGWLYQKSTATFLLNKSGTDSLGNSYIDY
ncbi:MAG: prepilin-type N-terminal cleavage/methylation domain-containing protein [Planctomycetota bacterium]|jgi:prepilin-type N-terminal cleavage/methylation domain-containing protein